ncbi:hypothetical protein QYF36_010081 [Acer negundo]|nr:hypothetical protein QYF36_010081 [Acer negundo]
MKEVKKLGRKSEESEVGKGAGTSAASVALERAMIFANPLVLPASILSGSKQPDPHPVDAPTHSSSRSMGADVGSGTQLPVWTPPPPPPPPPAPRMSSGFHLPELTPFASTSSSA